MKVIVIGGGPAGVTAALRASELGAEVILVEAGRMGGTCTNDGCVPTRVLAKTARLLRDSAQFENYGLSTSPPTLDFTRLMEHVQQVVYAMHEKKQLIQRLEQAGVTVLSEVGKATSPAPTPLPSRMGADWKQTASSFAPGGARAGSISPEKNSR